jgi:hypothetical protein
MFLGAPIGSSAVYPTVSGQVGTLPADIPVSPQLIKGDHIYAVQHGCGLVSSKSAAVPVQPLPRPGVPAIAPPVETCMKSVTVSNVLPGAHVDVYVNNAWRGSGIATASTVEVQILFGPLRAGDAITARQAICEFVVGPGEKPEFVVSSAGFYYLTQHFDVARTGWFPYETTLTVANVPTLKNKFTHNVDGTVYAQPLYAHRVDIPGAGPHNVVYVATENDTVYAFDADTNQPALWQRSLIPPGEQIVTEADVSTNQPATSCNNIVPVIGITSTPVIDCGTYTMYVVAKTKKTVGSNTTFHYRLYALDITTGYDRIGPVEISGSVPGTGEPNDGHGHVFFDPHWHLNRPGLLLLNGVVYVGFGSHCDKHLDPQDPLPRYHGWVFGYSAATLAPAGAFSACPDVPINQWGRSGAGIWQSGMGLAADPQGFVYFATGNGDLTVNLPGGRNYGDTVVKLQNNFTVPDYFTPSDQPKLLEGDIDLGSGGVLILPDPPLGMHLLPLLVTCGKDGNVLLIDRNNMGKYTPGGPDKLVQFPPVPQSGVWGGPAYYHSANQQFIYYCGDSSPLRAYVFSGNSLTFSTQSPSAFPGEGGATSNVSSNQQTPGTGVVWAITRSNPLRLQAFDATNVAHQILDMPAGPWNNPNGGPFIEPTVIRGKVYVPSDGKVTVFGL